MSMQPGTTTFRGMFMILFLVTFLTSGCSSVPVESEGRKFFEDKGAEKQVFKVRTFTKTNGIGDEKQYTLEYEAEFECLKPSTEPGTTGVVQPPFPDCDKANQIIKQKGTLIFVKTEQGWRVDGWSMSH
jgi:hypothetical protein